MELRHLRYFVAVAEEMNFRRAAEKLFMEQPPLSRQIQQLEGEIGVLLFQRIRRHIELTAAGRVFLEEARQTLAQADQAVHAAQKASRGEQDNMIVGYSFGVDKSKAFDSAFPAVVRMFHRHHPRIGLTLTEMCSSAQAQALNENQMDVGFLQIPVTDEALASHCLSLEPLVLALPQDHPLANLPELSLCALAKEKFLLFLKQLYPSLYADIMAT